MKEISIDQIRLFRSIFRGRTDVYAIRWERGGKKGYFPVRKPFSPMSYDPLTDSVIKRHLTGEHTIGMYPMLSDSHVYFTAIDFDASDWWKACSEVFRCFSKYGIPSYIERSRSGNGGHVWVFFKERIPAGSVRILVHEILRLSLGESRNWQSFDRIFPHQNELSGKGLGNLIALPLQGRSLSIGNSIFLNPETGEDIEDQWAYLRMIRKIGTEEINRSMKIFGLEFPNPAPTTVEKRLKIRINSQISINEIGLPKSLYDWLRNELSVSNPRYFMLKNSGKRTYGTEKRRWLLKQKDGKLLVPVRFLESLLSYCQEANIPYSLEDFRKNHEDFHFDCNIKLFDFQKPVLEIINEVDYGVFVAPPGSGKTVIALKTIGQKKKRSLIVVHRRQLLEQWLDRIEEFLEIPRSEVGLIKSGKKTIGDKVTIGMVQTLARSKKIPFEWKDVFGTVIIDECHHVPSSQYQKIISQIDCSYLFGFTATPIRKDKDEKFIFSQLGPLLADIVPKKDVFHPELSIQIHIKRTQFSYPFDTKKDSFPKLLSSLITDNDRNTLIAQDIEAVVHRKKKCLVISERKEHLNLLNDLIQAELIILTGELSKVERANSFAKILLQEFEVVLTTGQFIGEGIDLPSFDALFLVFPLSFKGKLIQYIGRAKRGEMRPEIFDYRDHKVPVLERMFKKREKVYRDSFQR